MRANSSGSVLFALDLIALVIAAVPVVVWAPGMAAALPPYPATHLLALYAMGLYRRDALLDTRRSLGRLPLVVGMGALGGLIVAELLGLGAGDRLHQLAFAVLTLTLAAAAARIAFSLLRHGRFLRRRLLVIGAGRRAWDLAWMLRKEGRDVRYDVTFLHQRALGELDPRLEEGGFGRVIQPGNADLLSIAREIDAEQVVVAPDERRGMALEPLLECKKSGIPVLPYLVFVEREIRRIDLKRMELSYILFSDGFCFGLLDRVLKRGFDLLVSGVMLVLALPFLLGAALAIRLDGPGPILYRQERMTRDGRSFHILKLRTMRVDAEAGGAVWAATDDDRITRAGRFLRRTRLDEIPQLINVLKGDMSLVGPRPERPAFINALAAQIPLYHERHMVKAGLTGWAQINYPYGASIDDARSKLSYDLYYVKNFSILFDLLIILQTLRVIIWPSGVR